MAKRGYKLQEFSAHSGNVNCLSIGKKGCRHFVTGGDDQKVNVWPIGKSTSLTCLTGHTSPVECVGFDSTEVLVLGGASNGVIKQWDLEESKMVRTLSGHRSNCTAVEFHPFGEFFASGSMDTNLRVWDIRKKGCIHTYRGHTKGVSTIKFTPDGRWVVSGGLDNVVKVWDLTAGKLLHEFKFHEGAVQSLDFHPLEFLLATGSADRTVKFWDLETFELIGSTRPEATGVRVIGFHPDGRTLFAGLEDSLKVYSWEPVLCHDTVDMGWSTLGDLCIHEGKLLGCSYYQNSVGVWVADISHIEPYGDASQNDCTEPKLNLKLQESSERAPTIVRTSSLRSRSPDYETKEIKNIYVDSAGGKPVARPKIESLTSPKVSPHLDTKETDDLVTKKPSQAVNKSLFVPSVVPRQSSDGKDSANSTSESITFSRTKRGMLLRPAHVRRPSNSRNDVEKLSVSSTIESSPVSKLMNKLDGAADSNCETKTVIEDRVEKHSAAIDCVTEKLDKVLSPPRTPASQEKETTQTSNKALNSSKDKPVKYVNGVAVVPGRTRSLVERFEKREKVNGNEDQAGGVAICAVPEIDKTPPPMKKEEPRIPTRNEEPHILTWNEEPQIPTRVVEKPQTPPTKNEEPQIHTRIEKPRTPPTKNEEPQIPTRIEKPRTPPTKNEEPPQIPTRIERPQIPTRNVRPQIPIRNGKPQIPTTRNEKPPIPTRNEELQVQIPTIRNEKPPIPTGIEEPQIPIRSFASADVRDGTEDLMQTHDVFLSTLRSRLTKLQVVRHFWERKDIKGAINAMRKLPDHSVQADVINVLIDKMDIVTLDVFSCLLPVLIGLLDSKTERHTTLSMEILIKLVAVFGPVITSAISTPRAVGVDLHAEQRVECCKQCSNHLQQVLKILPSLVRKGGLVGRSAQELNLVLQA
ncbi:katanin p80 WD40 repeat-containing subunit B1 homolog KTN80.1 isoform X2 [Cannabis sativa]|uniref:katanin p80 WD40 repeat-containing subunit B1 homolog KTN80.1 isoform X2 n=1 Tax=Cannabis sativa TaxID=3483 RepID=UPI0029C9E16D|nr:katanin p80 WD40 repeat-containing subunit B1 homolog KTN80.1 isoform X2 [Cannabis sativa]